MLCILPFRQTGLPLFFLFVQTVMFCFAAIQALTAALGALLGRITPRLQSLACQLWDCGTVDAVTLTACVPATVMVVVWFIGRHSMWAWPLQDAMGIALIMLLLRQFRLPDIKVGMLLLSISLQYSYQMSMCLSKPSQCPGI